MASKVHHYYSSTISKVRGGSWDSGSTNIHECLREQKSWRRNQDSGRDNCSPELPWAIRLSTPCRTHSHWTEVGGSEALVPEEKWETTPHIPRTTPSGTGDTRTRYCRNEETGTCCRGVLPSKVRTCSDRHFFKPQPKDGQGRLLCTIPGYKCMFTTFCSITRHRGRKVQRYTKSVRYPSDPRWPWSRNYYCKKTPHRQI